MIKITLKGKKLFQYDDEQKKNNSMLIVLFWYAIIITDIVRKLPTISNYTNIIRNILYGIVIVGVFVTAILQNQFIYIAVPGMIVTLLLAISVLIYPQLISLRTDLFLFYGRCLIAFYLAATVTNWEIICRTIASFHWIALIYAVRILVNGRDVYTNYMSLSYGLLVPALITLFYGSDNKKKTFIISAVLMIMTMFAYGARGPIVCVVIAILIYLFMKNNSKFTIRKAILFVSIVAVILVLVNNYNYIISALHAKWSDSRTISLLYGGRILDDSGRDFITKSILNELIRSPFHPRGILADRVFLSRVSSNVVQSGIYPHNFFLEIWYQFGILGILIIISLLWLLIMLYIRTKREGMYCDQIVFIVFVIVAMIKLMFTGSYFSDMQSWFCFGVVANYYIRLIRNESNSLLLKTFEE